MELKGRLKLIASKVSPCNIICDIGTDHAYIPIYLVLNGISAKAVATDVKEGPVLIAEKNIRKYKLEHAIQTRVGYGLECINDEEAEVIIIAGMGGMMIHDILEAGIEKAKKSNSIILQPMNAIEVVREWLFSNGFDIYDEGLAREGTRIYNVIATRWTGKEKHKDMVYYYMGEKLIEKRDPLAGKYLVNKMAQLEKVIKGFEMADSMSRDLEKYKYLYYRMKDIREELGKEKEEFI
ncbi:MAG: tRNA (adenine(22)-N(1))-methyltransferase [Acetivibrionales bacterium]|jgi:tRNA (adenine22-N1)-methyltransferase